MSRFSRTAVTVTATTALAASSIVIASPASAAARDGVCNSGEFCYYYNSNNEGSVSDFWHPVGNYGATQPSCYEFKSSGSGKGVCVKNNAASVWNRTGHAVRVFYNSNFNGSSQSIASGAKANLNSTLKNNNASHAELGHSGDAEGTAVNDYDGDARGFAQNNCTAFAAWRIASRLSRYTFSNTWQRTWGDAQNWDNAARAVGITVNNTPKVGGIVVNDVHHSSSDGILHGHVAYINAVHSNGTFDVEEYNWNTHLGYGRRYNMRISSADSQFQHVIHF
ncbi:CHAP domain-containing protein [Actinomadura darangshiensis]|uniref:CHAP domain-containing protein n=1 Tax=Actinomadura darangshiensis TaxID=705336 RepID=A0A4V6PES3_9ACTN|nr:CHAP domain-containing protein [Actinomadura darangshiensis]TDD79307.1 CHAP domain-containing protein [Actinomadura darangshiensis]